MQKFLTEKEQQWAKSTFEKLDQKLKKECERIGNKIPYIPENGHYEQDLGESDIAWWTNGFWGGLMWQMYHATGDEVYKEKAENVENDWISHWKNMKDCIMMWDSCGCTQQWQIIALQVHIILW